MRNHVTLAVSAIALGWGSLPAGATFPSIVGTVCDVDLPTCVGGIEGLTGARGLALSADDQHVYVCSRLDNTLSAFSRSAVDGSLSLVDQEVEDTGGVNTLESCRGVAVSPDGSHVYTAAGLDSAVTWFSRDAATGALTFTSGDSLSGGPGSGFSGANAVVVSPDDEHVYVASGSDDAVLGFSRDPVTGDLTQIDVEFEETAGVDGLEGAEGIAISPDGKHVYVASEIDHAVAVFSRETDAGSPSFGELTFVEAKFDGAGGIDGLHAAGAVAVSPDGANVYVASMRGALAGLAGDDWAAVFERSAATGALTFLQGLDEITFGSGTSGIFASCNVGAVGNENSGVVVSPNGLFVFLTNPHFGTVAAFSRSAADGTLSLADSICERNLGVDGIAGAVGIAHSADGQNAYTASSAFQTVAVLDSECDSVNTDLVLGVPPESESGTVTQDACRSITATEYTVLEAGDVTFEAPEIVLGNGFEVRGRFTAVNSVPHS